MRNESGAFGAEDNEMRESLDPATAERLLDGTSDMPPALANLLAHAAAPGRPMELTGETAALAAFRVAPAPAKLARPAPARSPARRRWLIAVAAATFTFASAGIAVAAATGVLPGPLRPAATPQLATDTPTLAAPPPGDRGNGPTAPPPDPAIPGLCRSYLAQLAAGNHDELRNPRFAALVELAGGAEHVQAYCDEQVAGPSPEPTHGRADNHPTGPPTPPEQQPNKQAAK